ncbi:MAG: hypothetical protein F2534_11635 [Actinobacteria bacterium]|nr:hypothetical protein [Actinomycetota bacterium]
MQLRQIVDGADRSQANPIADIVDELIRRGRILLELLELHLHSPNPLSVTPDLLDLNRRRLAWLEAVRRFDHLMGELSRG